MGIILDICREPVEDDKLKSEPLNKKELISSIEANKSREHIIEEENKLFVDSLANKIQEFCFFFDFFELTYKFIDNYGLIFQPKLIINIENYLEYEINLYDEKFKEKDLSLDTSNNNLSTSMIKNNKTFNFSELFSIRKEDFLDLNPVFFSSLNMDSLIVTILLVNQKSLDLNKNPLTVGSCKIPLYKFEENKIIETKIPIKNNLFKTVGYLYSKLLLYTEVISYSSERSFGSKGLLSSKESTTSTRINKMLNSKVKEDCAIFYSEFPILPFALLKDKLKESFVLIPCDYVIPTETYNIEYDKQMDLIDQMEIMTNQELIDYFIEMLQCNKQISAYELFYYLNEIIDCSDDKNLDSSFVNEFFFLLRKNDHGYKLFKQFPQVVFSNKNYQSILIYFNFIYKLIDYSLKLEAIEAKIIDKNIIDMDNLCVLLIESFTYIDKLYEQYKEDNDIDTISILNITRDIVLFLLNSLYLIIYPHATSGTEEFLCRIYNRCYNNCVKIIALSKFIVSVFVYLKDDMEITNLIMKIFKRSIQLGIDSENKNLLKSDRNKIVANNIRMSLVLDVKNSYFLTFLSICLLNLKHYPENYVNVLNILNQLSIDTSKKSILYQLYKTCSIESLISSFELYRFNLKHISKQINYQYYSFLFHLSTLLGEEEDGDTLKPGEIMSLCIEINLLFKIKEINGSIAKPRRLDYFIKELPYDLNLILSNILLNLTKNEASCKEVCRADSYLLMFLLNYSYEYDKERIIIEYEDNIKKGKDVSMLMFTCYHKSLIIMDNIITFNPNYFERITNILNIDLNKLKERITERKSIFHQGIGKNPKSNDIPQELLDNFFRKLQF